MANALVYIGLGTNLGSRSANLTTCKGLIGSTVGEIISESSVYQTAAWGITDQPDFLNQVILVRTSLWPFTLLSTLLEIEKTMGRVRRQKWGERLIDTDILLYDNLIMTSSNLLIPHPYLLERAFVLQPLVEIAGNVEHPVLDKTFQELYSNHEDKTTIQLYIPTL